MPNDFIILGGGVSGLICGYELLKKENKVTIFESKNYVGGLASTVKYKNVPIDFGPHVFHSACPKIVNYWKRLVGEKLRQKKFFAGNYIDGNFYDYPINRETMRTQYSPEEIKIIENDLNNLDLKKLGACKNYAEYVETLSGSFLSKKFFTKYPEKLWGLKTHNLSARFAPRRIEIREERNSFHSSKGRFSGCINGGCGELSISLKERILKMGGEIYFKHKVKEFVFSNAYNEKIDQINFKNNKRLDVSSSLVISTLPIDYSSKLFGNETKLYFRSIFLINIIILGPDRFPAEYDWLYFDSENMPFHRVGMQTRFSKTNVPDGYQILCCEIAHDGKPYEPNKIKELEKKTIESLVLLKFINKNEIKHTFSFDAGPVYPGYYLGHEKELSKVNAKLDACKNFYYTGSLAEYAYSDLQVITTKSIDLADELNTINQ